MKLTPVYFMNELLEEQLLYQMILYLPLEVLKITEAATLGTLLNHAGKLGASPETSPGVKAQITEYLPLIERILNQRPELYSNRMEAMSWLDRDQDGRPDYPENGLIACAFINPDTNCISVVFRGTPAGAWMDNAKMLIGDKQYTRRYVDKNGLEWEYLSPMQAEAMDFIAGLIAQDNGMWDKFRCRYVTGHSKGGNQAQLAGMLYHDYFDVSISVDGPGMSAAMLEELREKLGDVGFSNAVDQLYGFHAANDYVHSLGERLIPERNTIWAEECNMGVPLLENHSAKALMNPETGAIVPFTMEPGPVSDFIGRVWAAVMELSVDDRSAVLMSMMGFAQMFIGKVLPVQPQNEDWIRFVAELDNGTIDALGIILCVMMNTQEGRGFRAYLDEIGLKASIGEFCDEAVQWYLKLPLAEKIKKAKGVAVILVVKVAVLAVLSQVITMAEILHQLRQMMVRLNEMGAAIAAAYTQMVSVLLHGYFGAMENVREELPHG